MADAGEGGELEGTAFENLERDFQEILQELVGDKSLEHFRVEYEKLHRALKKSHDSEKLLIRKCRDLNAEIVHNAAKVQTALKLSQEDQANIAALRNEIERAWKMVETSLEKEERAKETIANLKTDISKLGQLVEKGAGLSINQENTVNQLVQEKNDLIKVRDMLSGQVQLLSQQGADLQARVARLEQEEAAGQAALAALQEDLTRAADRSEEQLARKEELDKELKVIRGQLEVRQNEINAKKEEMQRNKEGLAALGEGNKEMKASLESYSLSKERHERQKEDLEKANQEQRNASGKLIASNEELKFSVKQCKIEIEEIKVARAKLHRAHEALKKSKSAEDVELKQMEESRNHIRSLVHELTKDLEKKKKEAEMTSKAITGMLHERDMLHKSVTKAEERTKVQAELVRQQEGQAITLEKDMKRWRSELDLKNARQVQLEQQREKYASEVQVAKGRHEDACEELKQSDNTMAQLLKGITDVRAKLGLQKTLYENVRMDRGLYEKTLKASRAEIAEMKDKFQVMYHNIEQLKDEIKEKDKKLNHEHIDRHDSENACKGAQTSLEKQEEKHNKMKQVVEGQQKDVKKLEAIIQDAEQMQQNAMKEFEAATGERNILEKQLIKRNEELDLLKEKIRIQESILKKGETQYKLRVEEIMKQKERVANLKREKFLQARQSESIDERKQEVYHLQRELLQERTKVKALSEELENPMNVHRWRKLEGSDPAMYELILKVRTLQKRLIQKTELVGRKEAEIQEKDNLHNKLTAVFKKQPGPEVVQQLEVYRQSHESKGQQMKAMQSELSTYQAQVSDYKDEIERLTREMQEVKKKFFEQKRKEQVQTDVQRGDTKVIHPRPGAQTRFTGGGFSLAH